MYSKHLTHRRPSINSFYEAMNKMFSVILCVDLWARWNLTLKIEILEAQEKDQRILLYLSLGIPVIGPQTIMTTSVRSTHMRACSMSEENLIKRILKWGWLNAFIFFLTVNKWPSGFGDIMLMNQKKII